MVWSIPNILSLFRIVAAPVLLLAGWFDNPRLFFFLFGAMLISDALDGFIARMLNQTSEFGARLDSYGDILTYLSTPLALWWLYPEIIIKEKYYVFAAIVLYILPAFFALYKFGKLASYHTWITKLSALLMSLGIAVLLLLHNNFLFHAAVWFLLIEMIENITITLLLHEQTNDIHTLWHALKLRDKKKIQYNNLKKDKNHD